MNSRRIFSIILVTLLLVSSVIAFADVKVVKSGKRKTHVVNKVELPKDYKVVKVNGDTYYTNNGVYYKYHNKGYKVVRAPRGAKVKHLPDGVRIIKQKERNYYYFYHTWYVYDDVADIYIVVEKPKYVSEDYESDKLYMINGSVLIGKYLGGSDESVRFYFNDETRRIGIEEIISIEFGAALE